MMYYGTKEERDREIRKEITSHRDAAAIFPYLRKKIESFDGKVFNCRFEKALREDGNYWSVELKRNPHYGDIFYISFCKSGGTVSGWTTVCHINLGCPGPENAKWDGKRIPAAVLVEECRSERESLLKEAAGLEEMIEKAPELEKQLQYLKSQIEKIVNQIPYKAQSIYGLHYYVQNS